MKQYNKILEAINRGIQFALDDFEPEEVQLSKPKQKIVTKDDSLWQNLKLREHVVDLGLPSGTLWCKYNLGVDPNKLSKPEDWYGDYYAWGEIIPNKSDGYNWKTYQFAKDLIKYKYNDEDHLTELQLIDDPAYYNMHLYNFKFKMPTKEQFEELIAGTNNKWTSINGVNGYKFTNKSDSSKYIFLPAVGDCYDSDFDSVGEGGYYWSSSLNTDDNNLAWNLYFDSEEVDMDNFSRCYGFSIRPVLIKR